MKITEVKGIVKIAYATVDSDLVNWSWNYINDEIKLKYSKKSAWIYFIVVDGIIRKVGGTGMAVVDRARFYQSANYWTDKPGYCNAATNPIIFKYLQDNKQVTLYSVPEHIKPISVKAIINGSERTLNVNVDFRPFEKLWREDIEKFNLENNRVDEDLNLDGKSLQITLSNMGLKEVHIRDNKRIPEGKKYIQQGKKWVLV